MWIPLRVKSWLHWRSNLSREKKNRLTQVHHQTMTVDSLTWVLANTFAKPRGWIDRCRGNPESFRGTLCPNQTRQCRKFFIFFIYHAWKRFTYVFLYLVHHFLVQGVLNFRIGGQHVRGIGQCERRRVETGQQEQDSLLYPIFFIRISIDIWNVFRRITWAMTNSSTSSLVYTGTFSPLTSLFVSRIASVVVSMTSLYFYLFQIILVFRPEKYFCCSPFFFTWDEPTLSLRTSSRILKKYLISLLSNTSANLFSKSPKATVECEILVISFLVSLFSSMERTWYQYHRRFCYIWIIDRFGINHEFTIFFVQVVNSQAKSAFVDHLHRKRAEYPEIKDKHALFYTFS